MADLSPNETEWRGWFRGKEFKHRDYVSARIRDWSRVLAPLRDREVQVLEIGSLEGRSALFFLNYFPQSRVTCIDVFPPHIEPLFDRNLAPFATRLEKVKAYSFPALVRMRNHGRRYHVIYIDGDHRRETVMLDSVLCWPMLEVGGILIWDDYTYKQKEPSAVRPAPAIDGFLVMYAGELEEVHRGRQIIVRKTVECPGGPLPMGGVATAIRRLRKTVRRTLRRWGI